MDYAVNVFENVTEVKRAQLAESFMAEASRVLASSMDYSETLQEVARLAVPQIADWCAVDVLGESGRDRRVAVYHSDPARSRWRKARRSYHPSPDDPAGVPEVIRSGQARIYTDIDPMPSPPTRATVRTWSCCDEVGGNRGDHRAASRADADAWARSRSSLPFRAGGLTQADLGLAIRLGRRAGTAVENARLYTERTRIAHTLQARRYCRSPWRRSPGWRSRRSTRPAGELNEVGGDFYDVFDYDEHRTMLVIGDVCGKGPRAAA